MGRDPDRESTWNVTATASPLPKGSQLVVFGDGLLVVRPLPSDGKHVIGRSSEADIQIDHRSVSRKHAVLDLGPPLVVEDLGSQNGTRVRGVRLPSSSRSIVGIGDPIAIGSVVLVVQAGVATASESDQDASDRFVREEFLVKSVTTLAQSSPRNVVALRLGGTIPIDLRDHAVASALTKSSIACRRGPREYVLAAVDGDDAALDAIVRKIQANVAALGGWILSASSGATKDSAARALDDAIKKLPNAQSQLDDDHEQRALLATNLAVALLAGERHEEAEDAVTRALAALDAARTTTSAMCLALLAAAAEEHGRMPLALSLYERAIAVEESLGHTRSREMLAERLRLLPTSRRAPREPAIVLDKKKRSFRTPDGADVSLARRKTLWALFELLCDRRTSAPGRSVPRDELLERAWPGERMLAEAAQNRLYVAVAELRRLGLRDVLVHRDDGYAIDESIRVDASAV